MALILTFVSLPTYKVFLILYYSYLNYFFQMPYLFSDGSNFMTVKRDTSKRGMSAKHDILLTFRDCFDDFFEHFGCVL